MVFCCHGDFRCFHETKRKWENYCLFFFIDKWADFNDLRYLNVLFWIRFNLWPQQTQLINIRNTKWQKPDQTRSNTKWTSSHVTITAPNHWRPHTGQWSSWGQQWWCHKGEVMTSYRFSGAVVNECVLFRQRHVGGACGDRPMGALPPVLQEAVGQDGQQSQDGHRQNHSQRYGAWGAESEVTFCPLSPDIKNMSNHLKDLTWVVFVVLVVLKTVKHPFEEDVSLWRHKHNIKYNYRELYGLNWLYGTIWTKGNYKVRTAWSI